MSTEESLDPHLIEQTKQQIRSLVSEIARLTKEDVAPQEFYGEFLPRVVSALAAVGGAVWTTNEDGRLALQYQVNIQQTQLRENEEGQAQHARLLYKCLSGGDGMLVPPHSGTGEEGDEEQAANPTDFLLVLGPMKTDLEVAGVLEIFQRPEAGPNTQKGYLRFLMQMCELAGDFLKSHQLRHFSDRQTLWTQLEDFTHNVHTALDPRETAYTIANEGRKLIECDRVSVAIVRGNKCKIEAISGQDLFDKRSNIVRLLGKLATAVVRTGDPIWYAGDTRDMPPQVEDAVQEYVDESHSKNVAVLPLRRPELEEEDDPKKRQDPEAPIGALIVEQIEDSRVPQSMVQRVEVVCRHSSTALANAMEHQNLFLMPVWRLLGKTKWILRARTLPKTLAVAGIILLVMGWLGFYPADFELQSKGTLEPVDRQNVFARTAGVVETIYVEHRDLVYTEEIKARALAATESLFRSGDRPAESRRVDDEFVGALFRALVEADVYEQTALEIIEVIRPAERDEQAPEKIPAEIVEETRIAKEDVLAIVDNHLVTVLVKLRSSELDIARGAVRGKLNVVRSQIANTISIGPHVSYKEKRQLAAERQKLEVELKSLMEELKLYEKKLEDLQVKSLIKGQVTTFDVENLLKNRPVQPGQKLMRVADPDGSWQLELHMPENRMGHIVAAQQARYRDLREQLREALREKQDDLSDETPEAAPDETLDEMPDETPDEMSEQALEAALDEAVALVTDQQLTGKLRDLRGERLQAELAEELNEILEDVPVPEETIGPPPEDAAEAPTDETFSEPVDVEPEEVAGEAPEQILDDITNEELRARLEAIRDAPSYQGSRAKLEALLHKLAHGEFRTRLRGLLDDGLDSRLKVAYILASDPHSQFEGRVQEIHRRAEVRGDEGNTVLVKVDIDDKELADRRSGVTVTAKVDCGTRAIGYVWFHDLFAFIQSRILFRFF